MLQWCYLLNLQEADKLGVQWLSISSLQWTCTITSNIFHIPTQGRQTTREPPQLHRWQAVSLWDQRQLSDACGERWDTTSSQHQAVSCWAFWRVCVRLWNSNASHADTLKGNHGWLQSRRSLLASKLHYCVTISWPSKWYRCVQKTLLKFWFIFSHFQNLSFEYFSMSAVMIEKDGQHWNNSQDSSIFQQLFHS